MKIWQKIFLPSVVFTMIGVFAISMWLVVRSHTLQLEAKKESVQSRSSEVVAALRQTVEDQKHGYFLSSSLIEETITELCSEMSSEYVEVSAFRIDQAMYSGENTCFTFSKEDGMLHFQTIIFLSGAVYQVIISENIQPLLAQFGEDIKTVQIYGTLVSMVISIALLILAIAITKPIKDMEKATERIAEGDYKYRIMYRGKDELSELAHHMNDIAFHIEADTAFMENISESRRMFIANMTHELKTPLTSILGFADVLRIKPDISDEERRNYADIIFAEANRLRMLSSRLMELVTINEVELQMVPVNVADLLAQTAKSYQPICEEAKVSLTLELEPAIIQADETLFATLVVNLIDNARKASETGKEIQVCCKKRHNHVLIQVKDQGSGIPKEQICHVTEAFYMVDKSRTRKAGGAGIGLALCKAIATAHQGGLFIESEYTKGTTITVSVPLSKEG